jgi:hypothetical protein
MWTGATSARGPKYTRKDKKHEPHRRGEKYNAMMATKVSKNNEPNGS